MTVVRPSLGPAPTHRARHNVAEGGGDEVEGDELLQGHVGACRAGWGKKGRAQGTRETAQSEARGMLDLQLRT
jgi:hypothetical protein